MGWTGFQSWSAPSPEGSPRALSPGRGLDQRNSKDLFDDCSSAELNDVACQDPVVSEKANTTSPSSVTMVLRVAAGASVSGWYMFASQPIRQETTEHPPPSPSALLWDGVRMDGVMTAYLTSLSGLPQAVIVSAESSRCIMNALIVTMSHDDTIVAECADRSAHGLYL